MDHRGHYRILSVVGRGAMAVVYKALDTERNRMVALKVLSSSLAEDRDALERLRREAEVIARLKHPNIVALYEMGEAGGVPYLAMEFVVGRTLGQVLKGEGKLVAEQTVHIAIGVGNALSEAHREGIVHRDIKPGNILLAAPPPDGETGRQGEGETPLTPSPPLPLSPSGHRGWGVVKVTDFGLAKEADRSSLTETGSMLGTVSYISPEQIEGRRADGRSDLYALGAVMYEMLAGQPPFVGENVSSVLYKHVSEQPQPLRELDPRIPREVEAIVLKLLEKRPEERYPSADALLADLKRFQEGRTVEVPMRERAGGRFLSRMVGREDVFERLKARLDRAISGEGGLVVIAGETGIGKTRLAEELGEYARGRNVRFLSGGCLWGEGAEPYHPFGRILREYFGVVEEDSVSLRARKVEVFVERASDLKEVLPDVEPLLSGRDESVREEGADRALWRRSVLFGGVARVLVRMSRRRPLLLFVDDLHWASRGTVEMLTHVVRRTRGARILFLGAYRPEEWNMNDYYTPQEDLQGDEKRETKDEGASPLIEAMRALSREGICEEVRLGRLRLEEVSQMVRELSGGSDLPGAFLKKLHKETEGNPLFLLETLKLLRDKGAIEKRDGWWTRTGEIVSSDPLPIPRAVYAVIARRIERLSPEGRRLLECAAVEGEVFSSDVLCEVLGLERMEVLSRLCDLEQVHQIIHGAGRGYRFDHPRVRDVLYEGLSEELRAEIHRAIGRFKEKRSQEPVFELAQHFFRAGDLKKAIGYLIRAGEKAQVLYASWDAVGYYRDALRCLEQLPGDAGDRALRVYEGLGDAYYALGELERAVENYEQTLGICRNKRKRADLYRKIGWVHQHQHQAEQALRCMEQARAELEGEERNAKCEVRSAKCGVSKTSVRTPKPVLSEVEGSELRDSVEMARVCIDTAQILRFDEVDYERAFEYDRRALEILEGTEQLKELSEAYRGVGFYYATFGGEVEKGMEYLRRSLEISEQMQDLYEMGLTYGIFREVFKFRGDSEHAIRYMQQALEIARRIGHRYWEAGHGASLASEYKYSGDLDQAFEYYEQSRRICEQEGYVFPLVGCLASLGQIYALRGDQGTAIRCFKEGIEKVLKSGRRHLTVSVCLAACLRRLERILKEGGKEQAFVAYCREMKTKRSGDIERVGLTQWRLEPMAGQHRPREEVFLDRFETAQLSPGWTWTADPKDGCVYRLSPGKGRLEIRVRRKEVLSRSAAFDHEPVIPALPFDPARLCRPVQGDFAVEVRIAQVDPGSKRSGGLIVYKDRDTYVILMVDELDEITLYGKFEGKPEIPGRGTFGPSAGHLRIEREGDIFTAWCSDGMDWSRAGQGTFEMDDPVQVGLYAYSHPTVREAVLRCRDFRILGRASESGKATASPPSPAGERGSKGARGKESGSSPQRLCSPAPLRGSRGGGYPNRKEMRRRWRH